MPNESNGSERNEDFGLVQVDPAIIESIDQITDADIIGHEIVDSIQGIIVADIKKAMRDEAHIKDVYRMGETMRDARLLDKHSGLRGRFDKSEKALFVAGLFAAAGATALTAFRLKRHTK
jgi:hypothetical protein